jgi:hypothetical protein
MLGWHWGRWLAVIVSTLVLVVFLAVTKGVIDEVLTQRHARLTPLVWRSF